MYTVAMVFLILEPVGIPVMFGFILYKNREALSAGDSAEETAISFDAFKKTVKLIEPDSERSEDELRALYDAIDADASGEISLKEFVQYALDSLSPLHADELRPAASSKAVTEQRGRWRFDPEDLSFLVKAFEPEYYCESRPALAALTTMTSAALRAGFELVNYLKKFILAGVLVFVEPGSASQLYVALVISFFFFALLCRTLPYKVLKTDRVAVVAEANLFFTVLCLLMLCVPNVHSVCFCQLTVAVVVGAASSTWRVSYCRYHSTTAPLLQPTASPPCSLWVSASCSVSVGSQQSGSTARTSHRALGM